MYRLTVHRNVWDFFTTTELRKKIGMAIQHDETWLK
jgi:hypothetical protein